MKETVSLWDQAGFLVSIACFFVAWRLLVPSFRAKGYGSFSAHGAAIGLAFFAMLSVFGVLVMPDIAAFLIAAITAAAIYLVTKKPIAPKVQGSHFTAEPAPPPVSEPSAADLEAIEAARLRSIGASKKAGKARQEDMAARGEKQANPLWLDDYHRNSSGGGSSSGIEDDVRTLGIPFTEIEFDYVDAKGDRSHRTVEVWAVDDEYFEGHCHKANDTRTFVIGRMRGKVTVHDTGELLTPRQWAAQARQDPLNPGHVHGRPDTA